MHRLDGWAAVQTIKELEQIISSTPNRILALALKSLRVKPMELKAEIILMQTIPELKAQTPPVQQKNGNDNTNLQAGARNAGEVDIRTSYNRPAAESASSGMGGSDTGTSIDIGLSAEAREVSLPASDSGKQSQSGTDGSSTITEPALGAGRVTSRTSNETNEATDNTNTSSNSNDNGQSAGQVANPTQSNSNSNSNSAQADATSESKETPTMADLPEEWQALNFVFPRELRKMRRNTIKEIDEAVRKGTTDKQEMEQLQTKLDSIEAVLRMNRQPISFD